MRRWLVLLVFAALLGPAGAAAEKYALLVGVGQYADRNVTPLEGPAHDLAALSRILGNQWGVKNLVVLQDSQATKANILKELNRLVEVTRPGDEVFFYYSGHGTSFHAPVTQFLDPTTGGVIPYDFKAGNVQQMKASLIIGNVDLKPILAKLDQDRRVLVVFDSCYSGNAVRNLRPKGTPRYYTPRAALEDLTGEATPTKKTEEFKAPAEAAYPYQNLVYISAASKREEAQDISSALLRSGQERTIDARPHGALTDALLRGLAGEANTNRDGTITLAELYHYVRGNVSSRFSHTPQVLYNDKTASVLDRPVLGLTTAPAPASLAEPGRDLVVALEGPAEELRPRLEGLKGVKLVAADYDLLIAKHGQSYLLTLANGFTLVSVAADKPQTVVEVINRRVRLKGLVGLTYPQQKFNVGLDLLGKGGVLTEGDKIGFAIRPEADSHILLINIDPHGFISVIYPYKDEEMALVKGGRELRLPDIGEVTAPGFGTEYLKVFAFRQRPAGFERLKGAEFWPEDPKFNDLLRMLEQAPEAAQMTMTVKTVAKADLTQPGR